MKRFLSIALTLVLLIGTLSVAAFATTDAGGLTGPGTVRAGDTITLSFKLSGKGILGASGTLQYDASQLTLKETKQKIASPWMVEFSGNNFVAYDNNQTRPINGNSILFTVTFAVKNLKPGTRINVSFVNVLASDGKEDANVGTVSYSAVIKEPLKTDNTLTALKVRNATISPAFNPSVTSYTAEVPFSVSKLDISATPAGGAKVTIENPNLVPNGTTHVKITVKAENGSARTYTIAVKRAQDPNYVPSGDNALKNISIDGFRLSPVFSAERTEYVVWLPYETDHITITGTANDSRASVKVEGGDALAAGKDNTVTIICTAENGEKKVYTVIAKRAAPFDAEPTEPTIPETEPETEPQTEPETEPAPTEPAAPEKPAEKSGAPVWLVIVLCIVMLGAGFGGGILVDKKFLKNK